jgi:hypothetical protein
MDSSEALLREEELRHGLLAGTLGRTADLGCLAGPTDGRGTGSAAGPLLGGGKGPQLGASARRSWSPGRKLDTLSRQLAPASWQVQVQQVRL